MFADSAESERTYLDGAMRLKSYRSQEQIRPLALACRWAENCLCILTGGERTGVKEMRQEPIRSAAGPRVLVVEDDPGIALLLTHNLNANSYVAESVGRGDEAELSLAESPPDLVILDWTLPGRSGLEICARLREREETRDLPIIMLTARSAESERIRGLTAGADDYVVKPFSVNELMARVRALLRRSRPERIAERLTAGDIALDRATQRVAKKLFREALDEGLLLGQEGRFELLRGLELGAIGQLAADVQRR